MRLDRPNDAIERPILHHRHVEDPHAIDGIEEADSLPLPNKTLVVDFASGHLRGHRGQRHRLAPRTEATEKAVPRVGENEKLPLPGNRVGQRIGIEADVEAITELEADAAHDRLPEGMENTCLERPEDRVIPAAVAPRLLVLVAPMPKRATVEPGILREERRRGADGSKPPRFLGVEVKLPVAVDRQLPIGKRLRDERSAVWLEGRGGRRVSGGHHRGHSGRRQVGMPAKVGEEADEIAPVSRVERLHQPVGHHAATLLDDVDVGLRKRLTGPRRRIAEDQ